VKKVSPTSPLSDSVTVGAHVAVIGNGNATFKAWTVSGVTIDCPGLVFSLQRKFPRRDVVRIFQCENKTFQTVICLEEIAFV
jgi:hypothetical protein